MIECDNLVKIYKTKDIEVLALQGLDLTVERWRAYGYYQVTAEAANPHFLT